MRQVVVAATLALAALVWVASVGAQSAPAPAASAAAPADVLTVAAGEQLLLELETSLHTRHTQQGEHAYFITMDEVLVGYHVAIPRGSSVRATVSKIKRPGRIKGRAEIRLRFEEVILPDGTTLPLNASVIRAGFTQVSNPKKGEPRLKGEGGQGRDMVVVAQGGLQGALLGAAVGGGKGAAYGSAVGAGVGLLSVLFKRGPDLDLPRGMMFEIELDHTLDVPEAAAQRATQIARSNPPPAFSAAGGYPSDTLPPEDAEPVPDFSEEASAESEPAETAPATTDREPLPPPAAPEPPPSVWEDPNLGDPDGYRFKVDVRLVMLDAVVRGRGGRPLDNLTKEDFRLFEDGEEQKIRHFSRDELPLAVALVVDRSGSVAPYMRELRRAAYQTLTQLKPDDQVALFAFASDVRRLEDLTTDRQRIADRIARIRAGGGTNITDALFDATYYLSAVAPDRRKAIILISDNQATTKGRSSQGQLIRMALESETVVYSIKTVGEPTPLTMRLPIWMSGMGSVRKVTRETGGEIIDVRRVGSLQAALAAVISRLKLRYTLGYQSTNKERDGAFRKIDVRLVDRFGRADSDYSVHTRRGYYAPAEVVAKAKQ